MKLIQAFLFRDVSIEKKYRFDYFARIVNAVFQIVIFFFIGRIIQGDYFTFVLAGIMFSRFFGFWLGAFSENIRMEQYWGTAESIFLSPRNPAAVVLASVSGKLVFLLLELLAYFAAGKYILGAKFTLAGAVSFIPFFAFSCIVFSGLGLLSAGFILLYKRGDPVTMFVPLAVDLLSGVYFPLTVLPGKFKTLAQILPTTQVLDAWRGLLSGGAAPNPNMLIVLGAWALVFWTAGILFFRYAYDRSRMKGELGTY